MAEIRFRAERHLGEMMAEQKANGELDKGGGNIPGMAGVRKTPALNLPTKPTLKQVGIDKNLAKRARKLAAVPTKEFERQVTFCLVMLVGASTPRRTGSFSRQFPVVVFGRRKF